MTKLIPYFEDHLRRKNDVVRRTAGQVDSVFTGQPRSQSIRNRIRSAHMTGMRYLRVEHLIKLN